MLQSGIPTTRHERQREYRSGHDFQERSFARAPDDEIELRNKPMTYQISNVDLSAVFVSIREKRRCRDIQYVYAREPGDNDKTPASS